MPNLVVVTVEGVLRRVSDDQPIAEGLGLTAALRGSYRLLYLTEMPEGRGRNWLALYGTNYYSYLETEVGDLGEKLDVIRRFKAQGQAVEMFIDPDPATVAQAMYHGVTSLLFAQPKLARPEWRPDYDGERKSWSMIEEEIDRQRTIEIVTPGTTSDD